MTIDVAWSSARETPHLPHELNLDHNYNAFALMPNLRKKENFTQLPSMQCNIFIFRPFAIETVRWQPKSSRLPSARPRHHDHAHDNDGEVNG
jgi:hypothetical protein